MGWEVKEEFPWGDIIRKGGQVRITFKGWTRKGGLRKEIGKAPLDFPN